MVSFDPDRPDFAPYGFTCVRLNPAPMRRPDRHNEVEINFLQSGHLTYLLGGRKVRIEANRFSAFWAAIPHQILEFGEETEYFVATLPLPWFLQCRLPDTLVQPLLTLTLDGRLAAERWRFRRVNGCIARKTETTRESDAVQQAARCRWRRSAGINSVVGRRSNALRRHAFEPLLRWQLVRRRVLLLLLCVTQRVLPRLALLEQARVLVHLHHLPRALVVHLNATYAHLTQE